MAAHPQSLRLLACVALASLPGSAALRSRPAQEALRAESSASPFRQQLDNQLDLQYHGNLTVGGQEIRGILDTGSFELVVFSKQCATCGIAGVYDEKQSSSFTQGSLTQVHAYGSGQCTAVDGFDTVEAGGLSSDHQAMWLAEQCEMPLLQQASFNAIVGIGPPGQPEVTAKSTLEQLREEVRRFKELQSPVPGQLKDLISQTEKELAAAKEKKSMLENLNVTTFSQCLGKEPNSPGWLVWNDVTRKGQPGVQEIPVNGKITWGVRVLNMTLGDGAGASVFACRDGCGSIVDTGTSLFALPTELYDAVFASVNNYMQTQMPAGVRADCSDLSVFPDLVMYLGSEKLTFPPSSYLGTYFGQMNREVGQYVRMDRLERSQCQLLLMDLGPAQQTTFGPMIILGMPFFREYYTTFDLGSGPKATRSLFVSKAGESCEPAPAAVVEQSADRSGARQRAYAYRPRQVDASKLRVPKGLDRSKGKL